MKQLLQYKLYGIWIVVLLLVGVIVYYARNPLIPKLKIGETTFTYEVAITPDQVTRGLSGRDPLPENHGMLFIFDHEEQFHFWMKEMKFPLDMIWIANTTVVDISKNVPVPDSQQNLPIYTPQKPVNRVFEVNAGTADRNNIKIGDQVTYIKR